MDWQMQKLKSHTVLKIRGAAKVVLFAILMNQVLTTAFSFVVQRIDPGVPESIVPMFSFITTLLLASWIQMDARRAYLHALKQGGVRPVSDTNPSVHIAPDCPKRWLVILHVEINPALAGL